jgi:hypothetical protein
MREQHLYFLALVSGLFGGLGACQGAGDVAGIFVDVTWYSALRHLWATSDLEGPEPSRVCRRLQLLRGWSYDKENIGKIFT